MTPYEKELYSHYNDVLRFANSLTKNMDDAKDLTQTVFLKCLEHATAENHNSTNVKGFLFVITKNTFITSTKRKKTEPIEAAHNIAQHDTVNIDIQAMTRCEITRLKGEGYTLVEISNITNIPQDQVKFILHRKKLALRGHIMRHR